MKNYQSTEWRSMVSRAEESLKGNCPLLEDEVIVEMAKEMQIMFGFIESIAYSNPEYECDVLIKQIQGYRDKAVSIIDNIMDN